jgi:hypothetical protein
LPFGKWDERPVHLLWPWASSNSNVVVIGWRYWNKKQQKLSCLSVYDLEAVKKPNSDPGSHLLYTLLFETSIECFEMNERQIAFKGRDHKCKRSVTVLNFGNFNFVERKSSALKENPKDYEDFKMKIIYDPYVDSYPFHELNCVCPAINKLNLN